MGGNGVVICFERALPCCFDGLDQREALVLLPPRRHPADQRERVPGLRIVQQLGALAPLQLVDLEDDARRGACRCAPSLTVSALRARIARAVGRDASSINLRILAPRERTLEKLRDGTRLGDYLPDAALPSRLTLSVIVTERIVVADFDYDSDETDISRFDPDVYADAQAPWRNH